MFRASISILLSCCYLIGSNIVVHAQAMDILHNETEHTSCDCQFIVSDEHTSSNNVPEEQDCFEGCMGEYQSVGRVQTFVYNTNRYIEIVPPCTQQHSVTQVFFLHDLHSSPPPKIGHGDAPIGKVVKKLE